MGDRSNPIKFGPDWMRNFAREGSGSSGQSAGGTSPAISGTNTASSPPQGNKVQLAKLRYGREEMLALYDRSVEPPSELKHFELLYNLRGKPPIALNTSFEEDMRENMRSGPALGVAQGERYGISRAIPVNESRNRGRMLFLRPTSTGRPFTKPTLGGTSNYPDRTADETGFDIATNSNRPWTSTNGNSLNRNGMEGNPEWNQSSSKTFRSRWQGSSTNWRRPQSSREDSEEWRAQDTTRSRPMQQQDKWDWGERGDRGSREKSQQWHMNRRTWGGDGQNNDDNLPEWAVDNMEACAGTFDSSGAFHGYSNDDSNLPKAQGDNLYPLTRSHTQGSFTRSKSNEEGSDEWWASEKAKKLSPKKFDTNEIKFKKQSSKGGTVDPNPSNKGTTATDENIQHEVIPKHESELEDKGNTETGDKKIAKKSVGFKDNLVESKTFDALMRSDINSAEASDERGNFKSVMINPNNSLRAKHQNIVSSAGETLLHNTPPMKAGSLIIDSDQVSHIAAQKPPNLQLRISNNTGHQSPALGNQAFPQTTSMQQNNPALPLGMKMSPVSMGLNMASNVRMVNTRLPNTTLGNSGLTGLASTGLPNAGIPGCLVNADLNAALAGLTSAGIPNPGIANLGLASAGLTPSGLPSGLTNPGLGAGSMANTLSSSGLPNTGMQSTVVLGNQPQNVPNAGFSVGGAGMGHQGNNVSVSSLFMAAQESNNASQSELHRQSQVQTSQANLFPMHNIQQGTTPGFGSSMYSNVLQQPTPQQRQVFADQWFYEDPEKNIQGPFSSKDMYSWFRAGFFTSTLMVRRACDPQMRPLGSYGPVVPFAVDMMGSYPISSGFDARPQGTREAIINPQAGLGIADVMINMSNMSVQEPSLDSLQFGSVGNNFIRNAAFVQQQQQQQQQQHTSMESLWSQSSSTSDLMWMQQSLPRREPTVNNLPMYFWDQQTAISSNGLLPEDIAKGMKTEDQILAQLRATQNIGNVNFLNKEAGIKKDEPLNQGIGSAPDLGELEKLIQKDALTGGGNNDGKKDNMPSLQAAADKIKVNSIEEFDASLNKAKSDSKSVKLARDNDKNSKSKENVTTKSKKKSKDDKKEEADKVEDSSKTEKKSDESSSSKSKKEEKLSKKELEKEKKEWIKEGFTIVKGPEKPNKEVKKKAEEMQVAEEAERKRKEEEKLQAAEEEKRKKHENSKKHQQEQAQPREVDVTKKAPWSAVATASMQANSRDGLNLAEIQRLEREKKLVQMKEQQAMMQLIAQQQQAATQREQEVQAGLGWAKNKLPPMNEPGQSLAEIQAEAKRQAAAAAHAAATAAAEALVTQALDEGRSPPPATSTPWGKIHNGGFWDTENSSSPFVKPVEKQEAKPVETKAKKKVPPTIPAPAVNHPKKDNNTPAHEFEFWCFTTLVHWSSKIDVPTFVGFLKDIESPFEVREYVKCYLGESKESNDFARQFLERRSKLLRAGTVTPVDDLCSPAAAINPRSAACSDYQEVKGKGKKTKKNKMLKIDSRILGFSVTAAEDRINVGDIDSTCDNQVTHKYPN